MHKTSFTYFIAVEQELALVGAGVIKNHKSEIHRKSNYGRNTNMERVSL